MDAKHKEDLRLWVGITHPRMAYEKVDANEILNSLINQVYTKAFDREIDFRVPIKLVDDPEVAHFIFKNPQIFEKNYDFFESLGRGRFSSNGDDWALRKEITQSFFTNATKVLNQEDIYAIYSNIFKEQVNLNHTNLYDNLINAAIEIISRSFGLKSSVPWPSNYVRSLRDLLKRHQAISWAENFDVEAFSLNRILINQTFQSIKNLWQENAELSSFLKKMDKNASGIKNFDASEELMQNLLASSETVASSVLWIIENATRYSNLFKNISEADIDLFILECLRLYPPVPFVTRVCNEDHEFGKMIFKKNESVIISIVGFHTHPNFWREPSEFNPMRKEFIEDNFNRLAYIPFLSGPRVCAGMKLANNEIRCGLKAFFGLFRVIQCDEKRKFDYGISSKPGIHLEKYLIRI